MQRWGAHSSLGCMHARKVARGGQAQGAAPQGRRTAIVQHPDRWEEDPSNSRGRPQPQIKEAAVSNLFLLLNVVVCLAVTCGLQDVIFHGVRLG